MLRISLPMLVVVLLFVITLLLAVMAFNTLSPKNQSRVGTVTKYTTVIGAVFAGCWAVFLMILSSDW